LFDNPPKTGIQRFRTLVLGNITTNRLILGYGTELIIKGPNGPSLPNQLAIFCPKRDYMLV